jgi:hypothetical protein
MIVGTADVRRLVESHDADCSLVLYRGRTELVAADDLAAGRYPGALPIVTRREALGMLGRDDPGDRELDELAATLDTVVSEMGG